MKRLLRFLFLGEAPVRHCHCSDIEELVKAGLVTKAVHNKGYTQWAGDHCFIFGYCPFCGGEFKD